ncbi:hypothetical protein [Embleya sp. NPDC001921]
MKVRRPEVRRKAGRKAGLGPQALFVPQTHLPGAEAEVDFGEVQVVQPGPGTVTRAYLFSLRLSYSDTWNSTAAEPNCCSRY